MYKDKVILYVDDEEVNLRIFKNTFRRDFKVLLAISAQKALEILDNYLVDVVITDQKMSEITGVQLLSQINNTYKNIPPNRLILSGYAENEEIEKAFNELKLFQFISKPWDYEILKDIIINAIKACSL